MNEMMMAEAKEKGRLLCEAIKIIEKLSKNDLADTDIGGIIDGYEDKSVDEVKHLILKARSLTADIWWEHLK